MRRGASAESPRSTLDPGKRRPEDSFVPVGRRVDGVFVSVVGGFPGYPCGGEFFDDWSVAVPAAGDAGAVGDAVSFVDPCHPLPQFLQELEPVLGVEFLPVPWRGLRFWRGGENVGDHAGDAFDVGFELEDVGVVVQN